jgi:uncharacterized phiE125 gp8 family phage protein
MGYQVNVTAWNGYELVSIAQVRAHTNISSNADDALLETYISAAREYVEGQAGVLLRPCTVEIVLDSLCAPLKLPVAPIREVLSVAYTDFAGASATLDADDYAMKTRFGRTSLVPAPGKSWPQAMAGTDVVVTAEAGYLTGNTMPVHARHAIWMLAAHYYAFREATADKALAAIPFAVTDCIDRLRPAAF